MQTVASVMLLFAVVVLAQNVQDCWNEVCVQYQNFCPLSEPVVCIEGPFASTCSNSAPSYPQCWASCNISSCGGTATPQPAATPIPNPNPTICQAGNSTNGCSNDPVNLFYPCPSDGSAPFLCTSTGGCSSFPWGEDQCDSCCDLQQCPNVTLPPVPTLAPPSPLYGYPDNPNSNIQITGVMPYKNSFPVWNNATGSGAYGFAWNGPAAMDDQQCPPLGVDVWSMNVYSAGLRPIALASHGEPFVPVCAIGCNWTAVQATGVDPCNVGSLPELNAVYSCFVASKKNWLSPSSLGVCAFNCSAVVTGTMLPCLGPDQARNNCTAMCSPFFSP